LVLGAAVYFVVHPMLLANAEAYVSFRKRPVPPLPVAMTISMLVGFAIGLLVPVLHRRSLQEGTSVKGRAQKETDYQGSILETIKKLDFLETLNDSEIESILGSVSSHSFPPMTTILERGTKNEFMYIIQSGGALASQDLGKGSVVSMATFYEEDYFGEHSLMLGSDVQADVVAVTSSTLLKIGKETWASIFKGRLELIDDYAKIFAERQLTRDALAARESKLSSAEQLSRYKEDYARILRERFDIDPDP
jgi:CRP-like cAMP-binding protein